MKTVWNKETGEARSYETVDAREILKNTDLYTDVAPEGHETVAQPVNVANVENEFRREPVGGDTPELPREQPIIRNPVSDKPRMVEPARGGLAGDGVRSTQDFDDMTVADLKTYAESHDIDLGDATLKADIIAKVKAAK